MESVSTVKLKFLEGNNETIIKRAMEGDKESFITLIKKYKIYLYKIAYSYVKNEEDALEILQECTYRAMINIKNIKNITSFKYWLTRIVINCALDFIKNNKKIYPLNDEIEIFPVKESVSIDEKLDLYNAIDILRDNYKTVIILKYFNDMTIESIANVMDIPENTVKTYLRRAKENLNKILKEDYLNE